MDFWPQDLGFERIPHGWERERNWRPEQWGLQGGHSCILNGTEQVFAWQAGPNCHNSWGDVGPEEMVKFNIMLAIFFLPSLSCPEPQCAVPCGPPYAVSFISGFHWVGQMRVTCQADGELNSFTFLPTNCGCFNGPVSLLLLPRLFRDPPSPRLQIFLDSDDTSLFPFSLQGWSFLTTVAC